MSCLPLDRPWLSMLSHGRSRRHPKDTFLSRPMKATPAAEPITNRDPPVAAQ